jgi:hypothetical protein
MHKEMAVTVAQGDQNGVFNSVFFFWVCSFVVVAFWGGTRFRK